MEQFTGSAGERAANITAKVEALSRKEPKTPEDDLEIKRLASVLAIMLKNMAGEPLYQGDED